MYNIFVYMFFFVYFLLSCQQNQHSIVCGGAYGTEDLISTIAPLYAILFGIFFSM
jgi:hypothetical protein